MKPTAWILSLATLVLLVACSRPPAQPAPIRAVRAVTVGAQIGGEGRAFSAEIRARTEARLGFRVGGKLMARSVSLGDTVRAGQVLARLDAQDLKLGQDAARAALASAQSQLELAQADHRRYKELRDQGFVGPAELDRREATLKSAQAQWMQAQAQAQVQGNQAAYASLVADAPGVVTAVEAEPGQVLAAGTPVVRLALDGPRDAVFQVPEDQVDSLRALMGKPGRARMRLWGQDTAHPVTLRELAAAADPTTRTFLVKADLGAAAARLGQTATVWLVEPEARPEVRLPLSAILSLQDKSVVWLLDPASMTVRQQTVTLGQAVGNEVVITQGLQPGDQVVTAGVHVLTPGQKVKRWADAAGEAASAASR